MRGWMSVGRAAAAAIVGLALSLHPVVVAAAAGPATIVGRVVDRTSGQPLARTEVELEAVRGDVDQGTSTATTARDGSFLFSGLPAGEGWSYQAAVESEGARFTSRIVRPQPGATESVTVEVYEPTRSTEDLKQLDWVVWVDREAGGAAVQEDIGIRNDGDQAYVGERELENGERAVVTLPILSGARNLQHVGYFLQCCELVEGQTLSHTAPILPGITRGTVRFSVPSVSELRFPMWLDTRNFSLLVPADVEVEAPGLEPAGETVDSGITYRVLSGTDLRAGDVVDITLTGLDPRSGPSLGVILIALGVFVGLAGAVLIGVAVIVRRGARRGTPRRRARRGGKPAQRRALKQTDGEFDALVEEIAALDIAFERDALDEETYRRVRGAAKQRLQRLRRETGG